MEKTGKKKTFWICLIVLISIGMMCAGACLAYANFLELSYPLLVVGLVVAIAGLILLIYLIMTYNKFVRYRNKVNESLSLIDIQLKQRFDLIPNLVNTVKGYAKHEQQVFEEITELRNKAVSTNDEKEKIELGNKTLPKLRQILMIAEDYPDLKSNALYKSLMEELVLIEDKIVAARRFYDSNVNMYNTAIEVWPSNIIANIFGHSRLELYKIDTGERLNIHINLDK